MKYPKSINEQLENVEQTIALWPRKIAMDAVVHWILQFDSDHHEVALRIVNHLNVIGYEDLTSALSVAYSKLMRKAIDKKAKISSTNTLFAGIGSAGKSGSMMEYHFRVVSEDISEENFLSDESQKILESGRVENLVLIDDIISTGRQASTEIAEITGKVIPLGVKNIFVLTALGMKEGIQRVEEETKAYTFSAFEYGVEDTVLSLDSAFYDGLSMEKRIAMKSIIESYGRVSYSKGPFGFGNVGGLIVFYYNTPNSTIPIIWSDSNNWIPLFPRVRRINGISAYYKQIDSALKAAEEKADKAQTRPHTNKQLKSLTIFVEGKDDEIILDAIADVHNLPELLGIEKISVISLGGYFGADRLIPLLNNVIGPSVFVLDNDEHLLKSTDELFKNIPCVKLMSDMYDLFNLNDAIKQGFIKNKNLTYDGVVEVVPEYPQMRKEILFELRRRGYFRSDSRVRFLASHFLNSKNLEIFIAEIRKVLTDNGFLLTAPPNDKIEAVVQSKSNRQVDKSKSVPDTNEIESV